MNVIELPFRRRKETHAELLNDVLKQVEADPDFYQHVIIVTHDSEGNVYAGFLGTDTRVDLLGILAMATNGIITDADD